MAQLESIPSILCPSCGWSIQYTVVKSDTNGNKGRWLAKCTRTNPDTGLTCSTFRWFPGSRTPSLSPCLASTSQLPAVIQPEGPLPLPIVVQISGGAPKPTCWSIGCKSMRIRKKCDRRMCKAHCRERGGCSDPAHKVSTAPAAPATTSFIIPTPPAVAPLNLLASNSQLSQSRIQPTRSPIASSSRLPMSACQEPVYASHMLDIFTTQMALEEKMREDGRHMEATRIESKRRAEQTVFVYAWIKDNIEPSSFEVQEGFAWPNFILNEAVLLSAGFENITNDTRFNLYRFNLNHWTTIKVNHVVTVDIKDGSRIFIKALNVNRCQNFTAFLSPSSLLTTSPNIRRNLAGERAYVRKRMMELELSQLSTPSPKLTHRLSPPSSPIAKRMRILSDDAATLVIKRKASTPLQDIMECDDSDSEIEFVNPLTFSTSRPVSTSLTSTSTAATTATSASISSTVTVPTLAICASLSSHIRASVKQTEGGSTILPHLPFIIPPIRVSQVPKWPGDFFAVAIVELFEELEENARDEVVRLHFERHFGQWVTYKRATFFEHRQRWRIAAADAKHTVLSAGRSTAGCWRNFMSTTPAPRAALKAARRRESKRPSTAVDPEFVDIL